MDVYRVKSNKKILVAARQLSEREIVENGTRKIQGKESDWVVETKATVRKTVIRNGTPVVEVVPVNRSVISNQLFERDFEPVTET